MCYTVVMTNSYQKSKVIMRHIEDEYGLHADHISPSVEDGVCIFYNKKTMDHDWSLIIEVYDDLEVACIIADNKNKEVIYREDIVGDDFSRAVQAFIR